MTLTLRSQKGSALTYEEMDENFLTLLQDTDLDTVLKNGNISSESLEVSSATLTSSLVLANTEIIGIASEAEAEAGLVTDKLMTPALTLASIQKNSKTLLAYDTNISGSSSIQYRGLGGFNNYNITFFFGSSSTRNRVFRVQFELDDNETWLGLRALNASGQIGSTTNGIQGFINCYDVGGVETGGGILHSLSSRPDGSNAQQNMGTIDGILNNSGRGPVNLTGFRFSPNLDKFGVNVNQYVKIWGYN